MKIGDRVILIKEIGMNNRNYPIGHQFTIVGDSGFRGWDLQDDDGNIVSETRMVSDSYISISEKRGEVIDKLLSKKS